MTTSDLTVKAREFAGNWIVRALSCDCARVTSMRFLHRRTPLPTALPVAVAVMAAGSGCDSPVVAERAQAAPPPPAPVVAAIDPVALERERERERVAAETDARLRAEAAARVRADQERAAFDLAYPMHGVAFHFLAPVRGAPRANAPTVGYLRRGATFRASDAVAGPGCSRGYHELPGHGFVCRGEGVMLGTEPQSFQPSPHAPSLEDSLPYTYAYTSRKSVAQYLRIPTPEEETAILPVFARLEAAEAVMLSALDAGVPSAAPRPPVARTENAPGTAQSAAVHAEAESAAAGVEAPPPPGAAAEVGVEAEEGDGLPDFVRMRMLRGFYVSVDGAEDTDDGRRFVRTVRGGYVRDDALTPNDPPAHRGVALGGEWNLPVGFVYRSGAHRLRRAPDTGELVDEGTVPQHTAFAVADRFQRGNTGYLVTSDAWVVRENAARVARLSPRPASVPAGAKWVTVDLSDQILVAYEGDRPVFTTTVSTGRDGFETPVGTFRIQSKHVSTTMDDLATGPEAYSIEDVPWTMYFQGNYALHGAFWHDQFGRVRSHGCVNLAPADARWIFMWSTPTLPPAWHGVFSTHADGGTYVVITP